MLYLLAKDHKDQDLKIRDKSNTPNAKANKRGLIDLTISKYFSSKNTKLFGLNKLLTFSPSILIS